jgi:peptidoglycan/LPS O-acetylase OafA/YrhL
MRAAGVAPRPAVQPAAHAPAARSAQDYLPALTGIRAFAAVLVLVLHANQNFRSYVSEHVAFLHRGYLGVDLFFILSGFIITHVYLDALARPRPAPVRIFLWHRLIRLFPAHATVLLGLIAIVLIGRGLGFAFRTEDAWALADLPWHFLMLHAWGTTATAGWNAPSWSISAEWFAYLLFPLLALGLARLPRGAAPVLALLALLIFGVSGGGPALVGQFARRPAVWLGEISHSLYLVHAPALLLLRAAGERLDSGAWSEPARAAAFVAALALAIVAASALFYLVERPARRRLRDRLGRIDAS